MHEDGDFLRSSGKEKVMIQIRPAQERGHFNLGWLDTWHSFSFGDYFAPEHMGFRSLRVINEDRVQPGRGFEPHSHKNMEIISYVLEGAIKHEDSTGTRSIIHAGEVQKMTAGSGVKHSEYNASTDELAHFLQIWITPDRDGLMPEYEQKSFSGFKKTNGLSLIASQDGRDGSLTIHQNADLYAVQFDSSHTMHFPVSKDRHAWVQVARGEVAFDFLREKRSFGAGDGAAISEESGFTLSGQKGSEILIFDLA